jgi:predicted nucleotidyltransferase
VRVSTSPLGGSDTSRGTCGVASTYSIRMLERLREHRGAIREVLAKYGASNPRLIGSVVQGTAGPHSDVDLLLDLTAGGPGSRLSRLSGIRLELEELLKIPVDVACDELLKDRVAESACSQAIAFGPA